MLPQICRWHFLSISIIKALNHNKETFAISLHIICQHHEILLEGRGWKIWMANVHYHDWSSDHGMTTVICLCTAVMGRHAVILQVGVDTQLSFHRYIFWQVQLSWLMDWSGGPKHCIPRSQPQDFYLWGHTDLVYQQEAGDAVWDLRFPQWFCCQLRPSRT